MFDFIVTQWSKLATDHPVFFVMVLVPIVTAVLNTAIWFLTSPQWSALLAKYPRWAAVLQFLDSSGLSPVKALIRLRSAITGNTYSVAEKDKTAPDSVRTAAAKRAKAIDIRIAGSTFLLTVALAAVLFETMSCAAFSKTSPTNVINDIAGVTSCVFDEDEAGIPAAQIAVDCGGLAVADVIHLLAAKKSAQAHALAKHGIGVSPAPSGSACELGGGAK